MKIISVWLSKVIIFKCPIIIPRYFLSALPLSNGLWYMGALVHRLSAEFIVVLHSFHQIYPFLFKFSNAFFFSNKISASSSWSFFKRPPAHHAYSNICKQFYFIASLSFIIKFWLIEQLGLLGSDEISWGGSSPPCISILCLE